jgi:hypothetical protein
MNADDFGLAKQPLHSVMDEANPSKRGKPEMAIPY